MSPWRRLGGNQTVGPMGDKDITGDFGVAEAERKRNQNQNQ